MIDLMKPRVLTTLLICSSILTTSVTPVVAAVNQPGATPSAKVNRSAQPAAATRQSVAADAFMDLQLKNGQMLDVKGNTSWTKVGNPSAVRDTEAGGVLGFDGHSAFYTTFSDAQFGQLKNGMAIEAYFKYDPTANVTGEHEIFSSQQGGGFGLGVQNGKVIFYAHDGSGYKEPKGDLKVGHWVHAVGIIDKNKTASLYLDGKLVDSVAMPGDLKFANGTKDLVLGGDAAPGSHVQSLMNGRVKSARLYNHTLTAAQVAALNKEVTTTTHEVPHTDQAIETMFVGPKQVATGHTYALNVHARQMKFSESAPLTIDVVFDPTMLYFVDAERTLGGNQTQVRQVANGRLRITTTARLSPAQFRQYAQTRLAHINLHAKKQAGTTQIRFEQVSKDGNVQLGAAQTVQIAGKYALDYNGDGIIGVGDIVKAPIAKRAEVAKKAEIKPYKHVIVLTTDGGGNSFSPDGMYYAKGAGTPMWTTDRNIMNKRRNPYLMDLFNKKFAMSTTAQSVAPAISAQNYISMLHGRPWETLPAEYQGTNGSMGQEYFADFGKKRQLFPSVFKVLQQNNPTQGAAAFSEWGQIVNAIVEPDAAVKTKQSKSLESFKDVADYVGTTEFDNTSLVYMQSDYMDGQGHGHGWYNDNYWNQFSRYDAMFKRVMDQLEKTGHIHDTLVIANADHGGAGYGHGPNDAPDRDIFIALGGETVNSGHRLKGGSNSDITALILNALQVPRVPHMFNSNVFDESAFLKQTDLTKKDRDVEKVHFVRHENKADIKLSNLRDKRQLRAIDMRIDLAGRKVAKIKTKKGVKVLNRSVENGTLKLTLSVNKQTMQTLATVVFDKSAKNTSVQKAMAASQDGTEILVDLNNRNRKNAYLEPNAEEGQFDLNKPVAKPENNKPAKPENKPAKPENKPAKPDNQPATQVVKCQLQLLKAMPVLKVPLLHLLKVMTVVRRQRLTVRL
ncbi:LamG-like jellyroll fold domain-containing protein [Lactiplantibacillus plajomi]